MAFKHISRRLSKYISSDNGQRFFNFAYNIGAAIVIWGALFKILNLPGGSTLLSIGMGTEVFIFILNAFDHLYSDSDEKKSSAAASSGPAPVAETAQPRSASPATSESLHPAQMTSGVPTITADPDYISATPEVAAEMTHLAETTRELNRVHDTLLESYKAITDNASSITGSSTGYVEQMQTLNRNIAALNAIYEIQLRSVSGQLDAVDSVNKGMKEIRDLFENNAKESSRYCEEAEKMTRNMQRLNSIYERMLTAMTINMAAGVNDQASDNSYNTNH